MKVLISIQYPYAIIEIPNRLENSFIKIKNDWDVISCFFSAGSKVTGIIDYVDDNFNGECRLW